MNITLQEPNSAFETEFGRLQPLPKHVFKGTNVSEQTEAANKGIGSGPFKVKEYKEGESITYERYDDYYRGKASLDQVIIKSCQIRVRRRQHFRAENYLLCV